VKCEEADETARRVRLSAEGPRAARARRGRGDGQSTLTELGSGTRVSVVTDLTLPGAVAQYGGPVVKDVSAQLVSRFADCLREQLEGASPLDGAAAPTPATPRPVSGLGLLLRAVGRTIGGVFRRLTKRRHGA
jgi:hypothetical protein